ncbi:hypothetical protein LCGC14_2857450 [marine sediment metagenome]|uniref:Replication-associated protein ORF2/G2P domain-containing protein n=1 Tax=marine sediment metagenome TaxID=412755 RepID=A0A0F9AXL4_9ZZZZ
MLCSEWSLVKREPTHTTVVPLRCHCWTCPECHPIRTQRLIAEAKAGNPNIFITLTSRNPGYGYPHEAAQKLARAWRIIRAEFLREHGKHSLPFICVFEKTEDGWPHLHIIGRCKWIEQKWLSERMDDLTGSPIADVRRAWGASKVAYYITKYVAKDPHRFEGTKRYWRSQDYLTPDPDEDTAPRRRTGLWEVERCDWRVLTEAMALGVLWIRWGDAEARVMNWRPP